MWCVERGHDRMSFGRFLTILLSAAVGLAGCEGESDLIWIQHEAVPMGGANFEKCVTAAIHEVAGVSVDAANSTSFDIVLKVRLTRPILFLSVDVQHRANDTAEVIFAGKGAQESDEERTAITPLLGAIAAAISKECTTSEGAALVGRYSSLTYNSEGGDLVGYEVRIMPTNQGNKAVVRVAEGDAGRIYIVDVIGNDKELYFDVPLESGVRGHFRGRLSGKGLEGTISFPDRSVENVTIRKLANYWGK